MLLVLWENDEQPLNVIGQQLDLSSNTLTPLLKDSNKQDGLKENAQEDKRQLIVSLTHKGHQQQDAVFAAISRCLPKEFNIDEYDETKRVFDELEHTLKALIQK